MRMRSELGRVRGLGAARAGVGHWWQQRLTAVALVPLSVWFVSAVIGLKGADHETLRAFFGTPGNATLMLLTIGMLFYHAPLGLQVVVEDYVHHERARLAGLVLIRFVAGTLAIFTMVAVLKVAYGG
ncbi:MAG: succinate dehydrogenase membrane anchor subunit [Rhodospirillaceae bacterium]|nr:MAG: succinate dehydrogenase membrane anchor subunit [Rhodospirillaceae bacterium]